MATLYELTQDFLQLLEMSEEGEIDQQMLADTMDGIEGEFEYKADGYAKVIAELDMQAMGLKNEIDRLTARKKAIEGNAERIKKSLENAMVATGKKKFKTDLFSFGIQKNPAKLVLNDDIDLEAVPVEYITFMAPEIDKKAVKDALKDGKEFEWAHLAQSESLRIK